MRIIIYYLFIITIIIRIGSKRPCTLSPARHHRGDGGVAARGGHIERGPPVAALAVDGGARLEQRRHAGGVATHRRQVERRPLVVPVAVDGGLGREQRRHAGGVVFDSGQVERCPPSSLVYSARVLPV